MIPLTSDTPRLRQHGSRSPVARRHANALPTKAAQIPMALRYHERTLATRSVHTLEASISHDTANDPAHQRRVYASVLLATEAAQIPMALRRHERNFATRSVHTLEANISHNQLQWQPGPLQIETRSWESQCPADQIRLPGGGWREPWEGGARFHREKKTMLSSTRRSVVLLHLKGVPYMNCRT